MDVRFGLLQSGWHDPSLPLTTQLSAHIEQAVAASESGYSSIWAAEHFLAKPQPVFQAAPFLARIAPEVDVAQLGMVAVLPFRHPVSFAEELATLDVIANGRFLVCLVQGWRPSEFATFGIPRSERVPRFTEYIEIMDRLMASQDPVTLHGQFVQLEDAAMLTRTIQEPRIPFWIGAGAPSSVRRAARLGDNWLASLHTPIPVLEELVAAYGAERQLMGLENHSALFRNCYVAETRERAIEDAGPALLNYYQTLGRWGLFSEVLPGQTLATTVENTVRDRALVGSVSDCAAELQRYLDLGFREVIFQVGVPGVQHERVLNAIRLIAAELIPLVNAAKTP